MIDCGTLERGFRFFFGCWVVLIEGISRANTNDFEVEPKNVLGVPSAMW
jgi:hypothetical protein